MDGAWVDADCWAPVPDYSEAAVKAFRETTGIETAPRKPGDPHWFEFLQFHREAFRRYLRHYLTEVKKTNPDFQLCSNWAFAHPMPEPVTAPVDFLSGDYSPQDSVNSARLAARYLARQGKPWDLMAWSFSTRPVRLQKTAVQLQREAAIVLALGGGFQAYFTQNRDGSVRLNEMPVMAEVAKFCRARQAICHRAEAVPQVGLLYSTANSYRRTRSLFSPDHTPIDGMLQGLLESQWPVEVLSEHQLDGRLREYPLLVVPECEYLEPNFREDLVAYVRDGGNLLLIGPQSAALFQPELGVRLAGEPDSRPQQLAHGGAMAATKGPVQAVELPAAARPFGRLQASTDAHAPSQPAASLIGLGKGTIAATYFSLGQTYLGTRSPVVRQFTADLARQLFPSPVVEVKGSPDVEVHIARNHGRLLVNLINTSGPHQTEPILESVAPVGPLEVAIRQAAKPARVTLEPAGGPLPFEYREGSVRLVIPKLEIHEVIVLEGN